MNDKKNFSSNVINNKISKSSSTIEDVEWIKSDLWFQQELRKGCCPYAKQLYATRYASVNFRCCTSRLHEIEPLQPVGGLDFSDVLHLNETSLLIQGDSLAEQHFLFMICYAWSSGEEVHLKLKEGFGYLKEPGTKWKASIGNLNITFLRWNALTLAPINITEPDFLLVGGWHHGEVNTKSISTFLGKIQAQRHKPTIVMEALPSHFPGGIYNKTKYYPKAQVSEFTVSNQSQAVCDTTSLKGDPDINTNLVELVDNYKNMSVLKIEDLFHHRGDAHIGKIPYGTIGPIGRDCLHFCVIPGIYDAIAKKTLATIATFLV